MLVCFIPSIYYPKEYLLMVYKYLAYVYLHTNEYPPMHFYIFQGIYWF